MALKHNLPNILEYDLKTVIDFECNLYTAIINYTVRIKWLMESTKRIFGLVNGKRIGLLLDVSDANIGFGRESEYKADLIHFLNEQLHEKYIDSLYIATYGNTVTSLWACPVTLNWRAREEAQEFIQNHLYPSGSSNLLGGIKHVGLVSTSSEFIFIESSSLLLQMFTHARGQLDCIVLVCGSWPNQPGTCIYDYLCQLMAGYNRPKLHVVAYDCQNPFVNNFLSDLASIHPGNVYHCHSTVSQSDVNKSSEVVQLMKEIEEARSVIRLTQSLRLQVEGVEELAKRATSVLVDVIDFIPDDTIHYLPQPPDSNILHGPLKLKKMKLVNNESLRKPTLQDCTSANWLTRQGVEAKKLTLFQVLAPNAYSQVMGYIPSIQRSVSAQIHERCMVQMRWLDGTVKNVHVDLPQLLQYQKQIVTLVDLLEKRVHWLTRTSRAYFGTLVEPNIVIMIDLSAQNSVFLVHIHYCLRYVLEQQVANKATFNMIALGSDVQAFQPTCVPVTEANLQAAWIWLRRIHCVGTRNLLAGLRDPVDKLSHFGLPTIRLFQEVMLHSFWSALLTGALIVVQLVLIPGLGLALEPSASGTLQCEAKGIYLFTSGILDQEVDHLTSFLEESRLHSPGARLHVALYHVDDQDAFFQDGYPSCRYASVSKTADELRQVAHCTGGRFHWFRETGIIESDDIHLLLEEIDRVVQYSSQCQELIANIQGNEGAKPENTAKSKSAKTARSKLQITPRSNAITDARQAIAHSQTKGTSNGISQKTLAWYRSVSAAATKNGPETAESILPFSETKKTSDWYKRDTGQNNKKGSGKTCYPGKHPFIGRAAIPKDEEKDQLILSRVLLLDLGAQSTSRQWLQKFSLRSLGLNFMRLVSNASCRHDLAYVPPTRSHVEARYCSGLLPLVNVAGKLLHLQYTYNELDIFKREVMNAIQRYTSRLMWLSSCSRGYFGLITEQVVVVLLDVSGSMQPRINELKDQTKRLIWEQIFKNCISFNLIAFNSDILEWCVAGPRIPNEAACHDAVAWVDQLAAIGGTSTEVALCQALHHVTTVDPYTGVCPGQHLPPNWPQFPNRDTAQAHRQLVSRGIYLLTDGKPDRSCSTVKKVVGDSWHFAASSRKSPLTSIPGGPTEAKENDQCTDTTNTTPNPQTCSNVKRRVGEVDGPPIHTITYPTDDKTCIQLLKEISSMTGGRYHEVMTDTKLAEMNLIKRIKDRQPKDCPQMNTPGKPPAQNCIQMASFKGDDLRLVAKEINSAYRAIDRIEYFQDIYMKTKNKVHLNES